MRDGGLGQSFQRGLPKFHWQLVETHATGRGVPDANYCHGGIEGWIEFKKVDGWRVPIRPEQVAWAERRLRAGGRVFLACRKGPTLFLFPGSSCREVLLGGVLSDSAGLLLRGEGGAARWPWAEIAALLLA